MERTFMDALEGKKPRKAWVSVALGDDELSVICIVPVKSMTDRDLIGAYTSVAHSVASTMHDAVEKIHDGNLLENALPVVLREALEVMAKEAMENEAAEEEAPELEPSDEGELLEMNESINKFKDMTLGKLRDMADRGEDMMGMTIGEIMGIVVEDDSLPIPFDPLPEPPDPSQAIRGQ